MALGVDRAIAELLRDGDPTRTVEGLDGIFGYRCYDDVDPDKRRIFVGDEPDQPDSIVTVFLEGGAAPIGGGAPNAVGRRPGFTVRTRDPSYATAQLVAHSVHAILDYFEGVVHSVPFFRILAEAEPIALGRDREDRAGRWIFSQSYRSVTKRYSPTV